MTLLNCGRMQTLNREIIDSLLALDETGAVQKELIELYLKTSVEQVEKLVTEQDPAARKKIAHTLRSSSLNLGGEKLGDILHKIEYQNADLLSEAKDEFDLFSAALKDILK